jgi:hypothetical protein
MIEKENGIEYFQSEITDIKCISNMIDILIDY